jgi:hypothetical protein
MSRQACLVSGHEWSARQLQACDDVVRCAVDW